MCEADEKRRALAGADGFHLADRLSEVAANAPPGLSGQEKKVIQESCRALREFQAQTDVTGNTFDIEGPEVWRTRAGSFQVAFSVDGYEFCLAAMRSTREEAEGIAAKLKEVLR